MALHPQTYAAWHPSFYCPHIDARDNNSIAETTIAVQFFQCDKAMIVGASAICVPSSLRYNYIL